MLQNNAGASEVQCIKGTVFEEKEVKYIQRANYCAVNSIPYFLFYSEASAIQPNAFSVPSRHIMKAE